MFKKKKNFDYFNSFYEFSNYAIEAATFLENVITEFEVLDLPKQMEEMHNIENKSDVLHEKVETELLTEFLPIISAEDILLLNDLLDNIVDAIEDILIGIYTFNVLNIRPQAIEFSNIIVQLANALNVAMEDFKKYKSSKTIMDNLKVIKKLEQEADDIYIHQMRLLHIEEDNARKLVMWTRVYDLFEDCADSFEAVTRQMQVIILKYS